jgi:putative glutamine amidotransferase
MIMNAKDKRPVIGIPTQTLQSLGGVSAEIPASWVMSQRYIVTLTNAGAIPWLVPLIDDDTLRGIFDHLDGVFLPGGADIDPVSYGQDPHPLCDKTDRDRDRVELALAAGGTLYQDLAEQKHGSIKHDYFPFGGQNFRRDYLAHEVEVAPGSRLAKVFGSGALRVNSMHHQGIRDVGEGLTVSATASDGLVEGLEAGGEGYVVGVQWHPEALTDNEEASRRLFEDFIQASRRA